MSAPDFPHTLYHNDLSALTPGPLPWAGETPALTGGLRIPLRHPSWPQSPFQVIERGLGKYIETRGGSPACENRILIVGGENWSDYRLRAIVTPLSFDDASPAGGICGILARYSDVGNYLALVLDRDGQLKLLQRQQNVFRVLASRPLEICLGQSMTLSLTVQGAHVKGVAGPYGGAVSVEAELSASAEPLSFKAGKVGLIADVPSRFGPFSVECSAEEARRVDESRAKSAHILSERRRQYPKMRLERSVPLGGLVNGPNLRLADVNGDSKLEMVLAQSSAKVATDLSLTRLTCLSVLDLDGKLLWQSGVPDAGAPLLSGDLPFQVHDLYGDGQNVIVCVFGYDIQIRDGKTGRVLMSATAPETWTVGEDFKAVASTFGAPWGDETLNMNVAQIAFSDTQGNGGRREIVVKDEFHHLAVLDALTEPLLHPLFRQRGNLGQYPWIGDIDGDGKDEILAGFLLLDDNGKHLWSLTPGGCAQTVVVLDPSNPGGNRKRVLICNGDGGLLMASALPSSGSGVEPPLVVCGRNPALHLSVARLRSDLPGLQLVTTAPLGTSVFFNLYDATGKQIWSRELPGSDSRALPVNWTGRPQELLLYHLAPGGGLLDGDGELVVEAPLDGPAEFCATAAAYCPDGRDALLAWDSQRLSIYVPDDASLNGAIYKPSRSTPENASSFRAALSLPPGW